METTQSTVSSTQPNRPSDPRKTIMLKNLKLIKQKIGEGGEAIIHVVEVDGKKEVFKQFRKPTDPMYAPEERDLAQLRIGEYAEKLNEFPALSNRIIAPHSIILEQDGSIAGYTMEFIDRSTPLAKMLHRDDRIKSGYSLNQVVELFLDLHQVIKELHSKGVVIGDFRPENVLCRSGATYIIDTESMQFGRWSNHTFSADWTDPRVCAKSKEGELERVKDADFDSDWYAFAAMLFSALTGSSPYGGIYIQKGKLVNGVDRALHRLSVLNSGAILPNSVANLQSVEPQLLKEFYKIFGGDDKRGEFPRELLERLVYTECSQCQKEFSAPSCPCGCSKQELQGTSKIEFHPASAQVEFPAYGKLLNCRLDGNHFHSLQYSHLDKTLVRGNGSIVGVLSSPDEYDFYFPFGDVQGLLKGDNLILVKDSAAQLIALSNNGTAIPSDLVSGNDRFVLAVTKDGLLHLQLEPKIKSSLLKTKSKILGVCAGDAHSIAIVQSEKGELYFSMPETKKLAEILDMPSISGTLMDHHVAISGDACWVHLNVNDLGSNFDYIFALDLGSKRVQGWTKLSATTSHTHKKPFHLLSIGGKECFFTDTAGRPNGFTRLGSKIVPAQVSRTARSKDEISFVAGEEIVVFNPVPIDILASEISKKSNAVSSPAPQAIAANKKDSQVYGGTLNTACWLYYEALASQEPVTGFAILREKGDPGSEYRVLHVADWLRSKKNVHDTESFVTRFEDDRCGNTSVELFAKITVHPDGHIDHEVGREMSAHEMETLMEYVRASKNEIAGLKATALDLRGARQRESKMVYV